MNRKSLSSISSLGLCLVVAASTSACDTAGVHPLRRSRDVVVSCSADTSTWLRTTAEGTEIYVIGSADPLAEVPNATPYCFTRGFIKFDSSTDLVTGVYTLDAAGHGTFLESTAYQFVYTTTISILSRKGSKRTDHPTPIAHSLDLQMSGSDLLLTEDGSARRLMNFLDLVPLLDPTTQAGAEDMWKVLNFPLFFSQVRVPSFGGSGMTQYARTTTSFNALITGDFSIHVDSAFNPDVDIAYYGFQDLTGLEFDGVQHTDMMPPLLDGVGVMSGTVSFVMRDGPAPADVAWMGGMGYDNLHVDNGVAGSGTYLLTTTSPVATSHDIPYTVADHVDIRATLPPSTP